MTDRRLLINAGNFLVILIVISACGDSPSGTDPDTEKQFSQTTLEEPPLFFSLKIDEKKVASIQDVTGTISLRNISANKIMMEFSTRCKYNYTIEKENEILFDRIENSSCPVLALSEWYLQPEQTHFFEFSLSWIPDEVVEKLIKEPNLSDRSTNRRWEQPQNYD